MGGGRYEVQLAEGANVSWLKEAASLKPLNHKEIFHHSHSPHSHSKPLPHIAKHGHKHSPAASPYHHDGGHHAIMDQERQARKLEVRSSNQ